MILAATRPILDAREDVVITDNHLSLLVPPDVPTIVVHHGCAATHYERVPGWRTTETAHMCDEQQRMFTRPNRLYVAPSRWVAAEFRRHYHLPEGYARTIVHWVPRIERTLQHRKRPIIIGDWRDENKGANLWRSIAAALPEYDFRPLNFTTEAGRIAAYQDADAYLCLSQSEGGAYSMCDAEAARLPIVSTDAGNAEEFPVWHLPSVDVGWVHPQLRNALHATARLSFYDSYSFGDWTGLWRQAVADARKGAPALV